MSLSHFFVHLLSQQFFAQNTVAAIYNLCSTFKSLTSENKLSMVAPFYWLPARFVSCFFLRVGLVPNLWCPQILAGFFQKQSRCLCACAVRCAPLIFLILTLGSHFALVFSLSQPTSVGSRNNSQILCDSSNPTPTSPNLYLNTLERPQVCSFLPFLPLSARPPGECSG